MFPKQIGRYEIQSELGQGGMASVYRAYDPRFKREVAIKVLPPELMHNPQFRARFEREAQVVGSLEHAAIVPVYDFGENAETGQPYIVMRLMNGGSLADRLNGNRLSIRDTANLIQNIAPALDRAHSKGVVHRDLKPGNILFDGDGNPFIADFGIAKLSEGSATFTGRGGIVGTPAYMSPEQARGGNVDGQSDIYSLGAIVFEMLTGKLPYEADTPMGQAVKHITEPVPRILDILPSLPSACDPLIRKAMAKQPGDRYRTAIELAEALQTIAGGVAGTQSARNGSTSEPAKSTVLVERQPVNPTASSGPKQNNRWLLALMVILLLGCVGVGAVVTAFVGSRLNGQSARAAQLTSSAQPSNTPASIAVLQTEVPSPTRTPRPLPSLTSTEDLTATSRANASATRVAVNTAIASTLAAGEAWPVVYSDDFHDNSHNWLVGKLENDFLSGNSTIKNGTYVLTAISKKDVVEPLHTLNQFTDFTASVDLDLSDAPPTGQMGLEFRNSIANNSLTFYYFAITHRGTYYLGLFNGKAWEDLVAFTSAPAISISGLNHITVNANGSHFILKINGQVINSIVDETLPKGEIALAFSLDADSSGTFVFDNLEIRAPK